MQTLDVSIKIAVIGAGAMGSGIAQVAAQAGHCVYLQDQQVGAAEKGKASVANVLQKRVDNGKMLQSDLDDLLQRIQPVDRLEDLTDAGLVIEAIIEDLSIKRQLFSRLEDLCGDKVILATNTSSISVTSLGAELKRPERLLGMHFFNPAPVMALVEVVLGLATDKKIAEVVHATAAAWGKKPVFATSTPGFIVNRVARPFYAESLRLVQEQAATPATLDALLREAGNFRMGPFELMDLIGHDVNYAVTESIFSAYYGDFRFQPSLIQKELVESGRLGRKTGRGFYSYTNNAERPSPVTEPKQNSTEQPVIIEGHLGVAHTLIDRFKKSGLTVIQRASTGSAGVIRYGKATLALTDGRMVSERLAVENLSELVVFDLAKDYQRATRLAIAAAKQTSSKAVEDATALLQKASFTVSLLSDSPGLVVMRTVAMLTNEAADAVLQGVASPADVDLAMCAGVNYPQGPLSWSDSLGEGVVWQVLTHLQASYGEDRYRPSLLLRRNKFNSTC